MKLTTLGDVMARRELQAVSPDRIVLVELGRPVPFPDGGSYACPFRITGMGDAKVRWGGGVDELQALTLTLQVIGIFLYNSDDYIAGRLYWLEPGNPDLGFPRPKYTRADPVEDQ